MPAWQYEGTTGNDFVDISNWNWNWTSFNMNYGDDVVYVPSNATLNYYFHGGYGNDTFWGGNGGEYVYGGDHNDQLYGMNGNDYLNGNEGNDSLIGGNGRDQLYAGTGSDRLSGGSEADTLDGGFDTSTDYFQFTRGDSNAVTGQADTIHNWDVRYDYIDSTIAGTSSNYREAATSFTSIDNARWQVENTSSLRTGDHVLLYNAQTDTGYLLSDLDRNFTFETGVVIKGAGAASDMNWSDII